MTLTVAQVDIDVISEAIDKRFYYEEAKKCTRFLNHIGCSINDFLEASIGFALNDHSEFDFGDQNFHHDEPSKIEQEPLAACRPSDSDL